VIVIVCMAKSLKKRKKSRLRAGEAQQGRQERQGA